MKHLSLSLLLIGCGSPFTEGLDFAPGGDGAALEADAGGVVQQDSGTSSGGQGTGGAASGGSGAGGASPSGGTGGAVARGGAGGTVTPGTGGSGTGGSLECAPSACPSEACAGVIPGDACCTGAGECGCMFGPECHPAGSCTSMGPNPLSCPADAVNLFLCPGASPPDPSCEKGTQAGNPYYCCPKGTP